MRATVKRDSVDVAAAEWQAVHPERDHRWFAVTGRIQKIARYLETSHERIAKQHGISRRDLTILFALRRAPEPLTPTRLLAEIALTSGATARRLEELETLGFLSRRVQPDDRRSVTLHLTAKGRDLVDHGFPSLQEPELAVFLQLAPEKAEQLATLLSEILCALEEPAEVSR